MKKLGVAAIGVLLFSANAVAGADEYVLTYSTNELSSAQGVGEVHERIVKAAKRYCPTYSVIRNMREVNACIDDVVNDLVSKVDHPRLSDYHAGDDRVRIAGGEVAEDSRS